jgi:hypothetical protein
MHSALTCLCTGGGCSPCSPVVCVPHGPDQPPGCVQQGCAGPGVHGATHDQLLLCSHELPGGLQVRLLVTRALPLVDGSSAPNT